MTINLPKIVDDLTGKIDYSAWNSLHKWTRSSLATAEILYHILEPIQEKRTKDRDESGDAGPAPEIDFSPIILSLAKAIEIEFEQHLLIPYKEYCESIGYTSILISKLKKDGSIIRYMNGSEVGWKPGVVDPPLTDATDLWTDADSAYLYVLEPSTKRLIIYKKETGEFLVQYRSDAFSNLTDFLVDEKNYSIYLLTGPKLYSIAASHLK